MEIQRIGFYYYQAHRAYNLLNFYLINIPSTIANLSNPLYLALNKPAGTITTGIKGIVP